MYQFWAEEEVKRQPSSESIKGALRTFLWGWWVSAQPAGSPMAPIPPAPACWGGGCSTLATQWLPRGSLELRCTLPTQKSSMEGLWPLEQVSPWLPMAQLLPSLPACSSGSPKQGMGMLVASLRVEASAC